MRSVTSRFSGECVVWKLSSEMPKSAKSRPWAAPMRSTSASGVTPSWRALSMIGVPCASLAHTYTQSLPRSRWKRTQMSVCTYSTMWPRCSGPLAYGSALVTRIVRRWLGVMGRGMSGRAGNYATPGPSPGPGRGRGNPAASAHALQVLEPLLVDALLVGSAAGDDALVEQLLDRGVHGA